MCCVHRLKSLADLRTDSSLIPVSGVKQTLPLPHFGMVRQTNIVRHMRSKHVLPLLTDRPLVLRIVLSGKYWPSLAPEAYDQFRQT